MSWIENARRGAIRATCAIAGIVAWTGGSGPAHASTIVVRSNGPSAAAYPPGKVLPASGQIVLKAGDTLTVLDAGGTRVLKGPGNVPVSGSGAASVNGFKALIADTGVRQTRTGATRGTGGGPAHPTNVWTVDSAKSGPFCVVNPANLSVWRPRNASAGKLTLARLGDGKASTLEFLAGESVRAWPTSDLPIVDSGRYRIGGAGTGASVTITIRVLPTTPPTLDDAATELVAKGCLGQIDMLIDSTKMDDDD
jgi:hypothetical protein